MKIAIISDIHSNLEAVEAVQRTIDEVGVDEIYFVGDVVGYGPDPNACTRWVMENADLAVTNQFERTDLVVIAYKVFTPVSGTNHSNAW